MSPLTAAEQKQLAKVHEAWPLRILPDTVRPLAELMRIQRPSGVMMCYFPCLYGTFLVSALGHDIPVSLIISANLKLLLLSFQLRSMLCTWNDIIDRDIDRQVARTRIRAIARGDVSVEVALLWTLVQTILIVATYIFILPSGCFHKSVPFLLLHYGYPFAKRVTHHPQLMLGLALSLGIFIAFPLLEKPLPMSWKALVHLDPVAISAVCMSVAIAFWTLLNDTIYAAQDAKDDRKAGVGSPLIFWGDSSRSFLRVVGLLQLASLVMVSFVLASTSPAGGVIYTTLTCGGTLIGILCMVEGVDLEDAADCGWWFGTGNVILGYAIGSGLVGEYLAALWHA